MRLSGLIGPARLLLLAICLVAVAATSTQAQNPQSGNISISGIVPGDPPTQPAVINNPSNGQSFTTDQITVNGTCPLFTTVLIYRNNVFAGSTPCLANGTFSLGISLTTGQNDLVAKVMDALNQFGPDSTIVTVYYNKPTTVASPSQSGQFIPTLLLYTDAVYRGSFPNELVSIDLSIVGGKPSYALIINWGDGQEELVAVSQSGKTSFTHSYLQPGTYMVSFNVTDSSKQSGYIQTVVVINGAPVNCENNQSENLPSCNTVETSTQNEISNLIDKTLPVYALILLFITFFLGGFWWGRKFIKKGKFE